MIVILVMLYVGLAVVDSQFTISKIYKYGLMVELNPVIRRLVVKVGVEWGVFLGVSLPTFLICFLGYWNHSLMFLLLGMRITLFQHQMEARRIERAR